MRSSTDAFDCQLPSPWSSCRGSPTNYERLSAALAGTPLITTFDGPHAGSPETA